MELRVTSLCENYAAHRDKCEWVRWYHAIGSGETPDISQYLDFGFYDWVWYKENAGLDVPRVGRFLGIANSSSNLLTFSILPESGIPIQADTVQLVTEPEKGTDATKERMKS